MQRVIFNFLLAIEAVLANRLRAFLTALGIIFGVAAVIAMLAIGTGAKQSILEQMKLIGTNNIVVEAVALKVNAVHTRSYGVAKRSVYATFDADRIIVAISEGPVCAEIELGRCGVDIDQACR